MMDCKECNDNRADCTLPSQGGEGCLSAIVLMAALCAVIGCATTDSQQPAKSATMNNSFEDCVIVVASRATVSNGVVSAKGGELPTLEIFTQTQSLESSGTESFAQTATQTPTTDIKPDIDVHYNDAIKNATDASKGVLESLIDSSAKAVLQMMSSKSSGTVEAEKKDGTTTTVKCENGQCEECKTSSSQSEKTSQTE